MRIGTSSGRYATAAPGPQAVLIQVNVLKTGSRACSESQMSGPWERQKGRFGGAALEAGRIVHDGPMRPRHHGRCHPDDCQIIMRDNERAPRLRRPYVAAGGALFNSGAVAVRSWAGANRFASRMLFGTPFDAHPSAFAPLM